MGAYSGPEINESGLVLCLDAGNTKSYPGSGTDWSDLSGNGNNGSLVNMDGANLDSANGGSLTFDGSNESINCGNILNFTTQDFSFNIFFYLTSIQTNQNGFGPHLLYKGPYENNGYYLALTNTNPSGGSFVTNQGPGQFQFTTFNNSLVVGSWNCLSLVRNGSSVTFYINGIDETKSPQSHNNPSSSSNDFLLGAYGNFIYSNVKIASFQAYNRALSASEIKQNFNALRGRFGL